MSSARPPIGTAEYWNEAAAGWIGHQEPMRSYTAPLSQRLLDAIAPRPGERVLELAAGLGETGFMAARLIAPDGLLISSDQSEAMLEAGRHRAQELGLENVEFKVMSAEWIDLPVASVDGVICRWGYMLMDDPAAALRETRRVLRPGGRLALAVWDALERNPWSQIPGAVLAERGLSDPPARGAPGPFALGDPTRLSALLGEAGFQEVRVDALDLVEAHPDFESYWNTRLDLSRSFHDAVLSQPAPVVAEIRRAVAERLAQYTAAGGALEIPARTLVGLAEA